MTHARLINRHFAGASRQRGVALAIVVWFIAGMSLLVAGIVAHARIDTQMAQLHIARAKAVAAGDGAVQLMLVDMMTAKDFATDPGSFASAQYRLGDMEVSVTLLPVTALVDINAAPLELLVALFVVAGGVDEEQARLIAENVVKSRTQGIGPEGVGARKLKLDSPEDLLRIEGVSRTLLDNLRDFIVAGATAQGSTDWTLVPDPLVEVLRRAYPERAQAVESRRTAGPDRQDSAPAGISGNYRADAIVRYGDSIWLRRRWIASGSGASSALPWHTLRTEPPRVLMKDSMLLGRASDA
jgi:general secretion pathway protein K